MSEKIIDVEYEAVSDCEEMELTVSERGRVEELTAEIGIYKVQAGSAFLEIGRRLNEAKELLPHGQWAAWLGERVEFSEASARRFMRLANEYSNRSALTDLGTSKALLLLALEPIEREEFAAERHEVNGTEKTVEEMSARELAAAIKERDEALKTIAEVKKDARSAQVAEKDAKEKLKRAEADRAKAEKAENAALARLEELSESDGVPPEVLERAKCEAEAAMAERIKAQEAAGKAEADKLRRALEEAGSRAAALEKKLALSDAAMTEFKVHFESAQQGLGKLMEVLDKLSEEQRGKMRAAVEKLLGGYIEMMGN